MTRLTIVCGLPGVGKTTVAKKLTGILLRTDVIRKELGISGYSEKEKQRVYDEMFSRAEKLLKGGEGVVLDATFAKEKNRKIAQKIAEKSGVSFKIIEVVCSKEIVRQRIKERVGDESEAKFKDYLKLKKSFEPIKKNHTIIDSSQSA